MKDPVHIYIANHKAACNLLVELGKEQDTFDLAARIKRRVVVAHRHHKGEPLYAYDEDEVRDCFETCRAAWGDKMTDARIAKALAELQALQAQSEEVDDRIGYTDWKKRNEEAYQLEKAAMEQLLACTPVTLAGASAFASYIAEVFTEPCMIEDGRIPEEIQALMRLANFYGHAALGVAVIPQRAQAA